MNGKLINIIIYYYCLCSEIRISNNMRMSKHQQNYFNLFLILTRVSINNVVICVVN